MRFRLVWHERRQRVCEPDRLVGQVVAPAVALVVDEVEDREDGLEALGQALGDGHAERDAGELDLLLRAHQALRHGRLVDEERVRDLGRREASERAQRQGDLRVQRQRRMAAGEHQLEALVGEGVLVHGVFSPLGHIEQPGLGGQHPIAADAIDRPVASDGDQPAGRARRRPLAGPTRRGAREGLLRGLLGEVEVAEEADQCREDAIPVVSKDLFDQRSTSGRTSMAPPSRAAGMRAAISIAVSRSSASSR